MVRSIAPINESEKMVEKNMTHRTRPYAPKLVEEYTGELHLGGEIVDKKHIETHEATIVNMAAISAESCSTPETNAW